MPPIERRHVSMLTASAKYLSVADFRRPDGKFAKFLLTVTGLEFNVMVRNNAGVEEPRTVVSFAESAKAWVPNTTNLNLMGELLGEWTDQWDGKRIVLHVGPVKNPRGKGQVPGVLVAPAPARKANPSAPPPGVDAETGEVAQQGDEAETSSEPETGEGLEQAAADDEATDEGHPDEGVEPLHPALDDLPF